MTNDTVYSIKSDSLGDGIYYVAVSVRDAEGLESPKSAVITFQDTGAVLVAGVL